MVALWRGRSWKTARRAEEAGRPVHRGVFIKDGRWSVQAEETRRKDTQGPEGTIPTTHKV